MPLSPSALMAVSLTAVVCSVLAFLLQLTSLTTPYWSQISDRRFHGLWHSCDCVARVQNIGWLDVVRGAGIVGTFSTAVSAVAAVFFCFRDYNKKLLSIIISVFSVISCLSIFMTVVMYGVKFESEVSFSFILTLLAVGPTIASGLLFFFTFLIPLGTELGGREEIEM